MSATAAGIALGLVLFLAGLIGLVEAITDLGHNRRDRRAALLKRSKQMPALSDDWVPPKGEGR